MAAFFSWVKSKKWNRNSASVLAVALFLLAGIALIYLKARRIALISDDYVDLLDLSDWGFVSKARTFFRPLVKLYFESLTPLFGMKPGGYHLLSQLLHWFNCLLLFALGRHFFKERNPQGDQKERMRELIMAAALAMAFAFSYTHSEAVFWIAATTTLLEALFILLTLVAYSHYLSSRKTGFLLAALALFALGLGAKEGVFLIVALAPLTSFLFQAKFRFPDRRVILSWLGFWAIGLAYLLVVPRVVSKAMHGGAYAFKIGVSLFKNIQQFIFSSILWTPFNDQPLFAAQNRLLGIGNAPSQGADLLNGWLLLGVACFVFLALLLWKGGLGTRVAMLMLLVSTLPYALPPRHISGWMVYPYPLRVYYVVMIFYILMLVVFLGAVKAAASGKVTAVLAVLLAAVALVNGVRVFQRSEEWIFEGKKYTAVLRKVEKRIDQVRTKSLWIRVVDATDNYGIFIRYSFPFYPGHKQRLHLMEHQMPTWRAATNFKPHEVKRMRDGSLTVFVIQDEVIEIFDKERSQDL